MTHAVLIPFDGSEESNRALSHALAHFSDAELTALHVINPAEAVQITEEDGVPPMPEDWYESSREQANQTLKRAVEEAETVDVDLTTAIEVGQPARTIIEYADDHNIDHIVMGSHGRSGVSRILLGSVAETVMRRSDVPVTIVR